MDDPKLDVDRLLAGDKETVNAFLELARRYARRYFRGTVPIESVAQSACAEMVAKLRAGQQPGHVRYWALNAVKNAVRRDLRWLRRSPVEFESHLHSPEGEPSPAEVAQAREQLARVDALLTEMGSEARTTVLALAEGRRADSVAREFYIQPGAVRTRASRARRQLRRGLSDRQKFELLRNAARAVWKKPEAGGRRAKIIGARSRRCSADSSTTRP